MNYNLLAKIVKLRRRGFLRLRPATSPVRLDCLQGACPNSCCKSLGPPQVSLVEAELIGRHLVETDRHGMSLKNGACGCCQLGADGLCQAYQSRPKACSDYPWYNINGRLYFDAGCPGIRADRDERPDVNSVRDFGWYLVGLNSFFRKLVIRFLRS